MLLFLALILWLQITFLRFNNVKFISDSVKTWKLSLIFSRNVDGCGNVLNNKQDFSFWDLVATDGYSKAQMVTGLQPTRYPLFSTWQSGNSWPRNDLFTGQLSLDNWMCVWERERQRKREGERKNMCVGAWVNMHVKVFAHLGVNAHMCGCMWTCMSACANMCVHYICLFMPFREPRDSSGKVTQVIQQLNNFWQVSASLKTFLQRGYGKETALFNKP